MIKLIPATSTNRNSLIMSVSVIVCPAPNTLVDGIFSPSVGPYYYGDTVTYSCNYGFDLTSGDAVLTCDVLFWNGTMPNCTG